MGSGQSPGDGAYSGESPTRSPESSGSSETLERTIALFHKATVAAYVKRTVALFALISVGIGFAGYLLISLMLGGEGILDVTHGFVFGMIVVLLVSCLGATLAAVTAIQAWTTLDRSLVQTCLICGDSCYVSVFTKTVLSLLFVRGAFPPIW